jgi:hypothetical protein
MFPVKVFDVTCTSANALGCFANAGIIGEEPSQEFQGLGWEGPQEVR